MAKCLSTLRDTVCFVALAMECLHAQPPGANSPVDKSKNDHSSPQAVYRSFVEASEKHEWQLRYRCLTPVSQRKVVYWVFLLCGMSDSAEAKQLQSTHMGDRDKLFQEYRQRYLAKHGELAFTPEQTGIKDETLFIDTLFSLVEDREGFYAAVSKLFGDSGHSSPIGELRDVIISGDFATGVGTVTISSTTSREDSKEKVETRRWIKHDRTYEFRKINGEWLIDNP
jgi:hypothetical protein